MSDQHRPREDKAKMPKQRQALSHDFLHGMDSEDFHKEAEKLSALTPAARRRLMVQLTERLKTPVDKPSWGPDWVRHGERVAAKRSKRKGWLTKLFASGKNKDKDEADDEPKPAALSPEENDDAAIIARNDAHDEERTVPYSVSSRNRAPGTGFS